jgi:hypothetical protein
MAEVAPAFTFIKTPLPSSFHDILWPIARSCMKGLGVGRRGPWRHRSLGHREPDTPAIRYRR